jgi:uncharacterized sporulation protein YeaH/YhbH (DUF444 family)
MRKFLIPIVAGVSVLAVAAPGSAQYARPVYQQRHGYGFDGRGLQVRVDRVREQIRRLEARRVLSFREGRSLEFEATNLQRRIARASGNGIQPGEAQRLNEDIRRLEYRVQREATDMNNRPGYRRY